jgi:hypothetical protein
MFTREIMLPLILFLAGAWTAGPVLLSPGPPDGFDGTAVKDPSIVFHGGRWHLFYTARGQGRYSIGYVSAPTLEQLAKAPRRQLAQLCGTKDSYAAAPQVFFFRPRGKWYLVFQNTDSNYQPVFSTTSELTRPESWSPPRPLAVKRDAAKWIDFWVLCDGAHAYLYFTRGHADLYVMKTALARFPEGWDEPRRVFGPLHESAHVYRAAGPVPRYLMLFETQQEDRRGYGLAGAPVPEGPWREIDRAFAAGPAIGFPPGVEPWTTEVSHGELLRAGFDERLEVDAADLRFLVQGLPAGAHRGPYAELPWRLGILRARAVARTGSGLR